MSIDIEIARIKPEFKFSGFSLGDALYTPLKIFAKKHANSFEEASLCRTYVAIVNGSQRAYVSIVSGEVVTDIVDNAALGEGVEYNYKHYPAIKIARLAVDKKVRGLGVGRALIDVSLGIANEQVRPWVGCRFAMVDAKRNSVDFYKKCGFTLLNTSENLSRDEQVMFIDLMKADNSVGVS